MFLGFIHLDANKLYVATALVFLAHTPCLYLIPLKEKLDSHMLGLLETHCLWNKNVLNHGMCLTIAFIHQSVYAYRC